MAPPSQALKGSSSSTWHGPQPSWAPTCEEALWPTPLPGHIPNPTPKAAPGPSMNDPGTFWSPPCLSMNPEPPPPSRTTQTQPCSQGMGAGLDRTRAGSLPNPGPASSSRKPPCPTPCSGLPLSSEWDRPASPSTAHTAGSRDRAEREHQDTPPTACQPRPGPSRPSRTLGWGPWGSMSHTEAVGTYPARSRSHSKKDLPKRRSRACPPLTRRPGADLRFSAGPRQGPGLGTCTPAGAAQGGEWSRPAHPGPQL